MSETREKLSVYLPSGLVSSLQASSAAGHEPLTSTVERLLTAGLAGESSKAESPRDPLRLEDVTLLLFNGNDPEQGARVLRYVTHHISFARVIHLTFARPVAACPGEYFQIPRFDYRQAMRFQARSLARYVETPYVLQIECDGFPVHPHLWTADFRDWDYIGAPWPPQLASEGCRVGNGGCSLRSRRFLEAMETAPDHYDENGDTYMCQRPDVREHLAASGIRFAPVEVAMRFSFENLIPEFPWWTDDMSFGFHGFRGDREKILSGW